MKIKDLKNKKILILGLGKEGIDALKFFKKKFPNKIIGVGDRNESLKIDFKFSGIKFHLGKKYLDAIKNYDIIVKSPGIPMKLIKKLLKKNQKITSPTAIFLSNCNGFVIGVTGTKGKSTTSSLIYNILRSQKIDASLVGNIGKPVLNFLSTNKKLKTYVYELSSFQLDTITKSPSVVIFLNIFRDHLDHHSSFQEYVKAKSNIFKFQKETDFLIYNKKDKLVSEIVKKSKSNKIPFDGEKDNYEVFEIICDLFQIPKNQISKEIKKFKNLSHRREYIGKTKGILFYNDSAATIPESVILAIRKTKEIDTLIVGGVDKGFNLDNLCSEILKSNIRNVIYFPETGKKIAEKINKKNKKIKLILADTMGKAVSIAFKETKKNKACLLSPGASSFNMFKNYKERGNLFKKYVKKT